MSNQFYCHLINLHPWWIKLFFLKKVNIKTKLLFPVIFVFVLQPVNVGNHYCCTLVCKCATARPPLWREVHKLGWESVCRQLGRRLFHHLLELLKWRSPWVIGKPQNGQLDLTRQNKHVTAQPIKCHATEEAALIFYYYYCNNL